MPDSNWLPEDLDELDAFVRSGASCADWMLLQRAVAHIRELEAEAVALRARTAILTESLLSLRNALSPKRISDPIPLRGHKPHSRRR